MSENGPLIWLIATAVMIILLLAVGTLAAAGLLGRDETTPAPVTLDDESEPAGGRR